ncbi:CBS domain-containing protein [Streptomyces sp. YU58]|uniref:CBS domain-containing protein n=1 Tax=Streptomyces sp. SX92 TaxID=3158972 RepID=UPI0027BA93AF|nr:CBS domain-containing protein [Streptomyces coralus]WLW53899.1 CBS domain-containing protein [Streptomyces coralus]
MTLVHTQARPASAHPVHRTVADAVDAAGPQAGSQAGPRAGSQAGPQVWEDMTVEVALSVMDAARTGHLVVCDEDGLRTGLVTRAGLTAVRDSSGYSDRIRLRDLADGIGPAEPLHRGRPRLSFSL